MFEWQDLENDNWQNEWESITLEVVLILKAVQVLANDSSLQVFLFFKLLLEVPSHLCGFFFNLCFCVCIHMQPLTIGVVPIHTEANFSCRYTGNFLICSIAAQYQDRHLCFTHHYFNGIGSKHKHKQQKKRRNWKLISFPKLLQKTCSLLSGTLPSLSVRTQLLKNRILLNYEKNTVHGSKLLLFNKFGGFEAMTHTMWIFLLG